MTRPTRNLPPLEVGTAYRAQDFESFEYFGSKLTEREAILRLHLKNETTIDLPTNDDELKRLLRVLIAAFGDEAIAHLRELRWI
jgi:hypothetical protein